MAKTDIPETISQTAEEQLDEFLASKKLYPRNLWLGDETISVYVRKSRRYLRGTDTKQCLDIATIDVKKDKRGQGRFTRFLQHAQEVNPYPYIYVENVIKERFAEFFRKNEWRQIGEKEMPCFYKKMPEKRVSSTEVVLTPEQLESLNVGAARIPPYKKPERKK